MAKFTTKQIKESRPFIACLRNNFAAIKNKEVDDQFPFFLLELAKKERKYSVLRFSVATKKEIERIPDDELLSWSSVLLSKNPAVNECRFARVLVDPYSCTPFVTYTTICEIWDDAWRKDKRFHWDPCK